MKARTYPTLISRAYVWLVGLLTFTGFLQMPLARRYYLTDLPGMAWTGDFHLVHKLHYMLAAALLFLVGMTLVNWFMEWRNRLALTPLGAVRVAVMAGIIISGGFRVYRNLPGVTLHPAAVMTIEWVHFGLVMVLGVLALTALLKRSSAYAKSR
ncbi:4Fe-4S ferredoxin [Pseudodesulfovibrio cashew]|uniref:4Fe-4S ferredoxin n=1 Tax=Pseudodesulfovibrio cashew TaxID=2678688 RepID=A0A6I6JK88_9BACT|nr:4Fe-4S ferredoxin [Pseudodesulfovibrio cashew]QGY41579.1 4Fe-4S ferredoxin [Pseudodesulfovibrio cashew]